MVLAIVIEDAWIWIIVAYGCYFILNALMATGSGVFFNHGLMAKNCTSKKRLDGKTAIVTGANRYVLCMATTYCGLKLLYLSEIFFFFYTVLFEKGKRFRDF